MEKWRRGSTWNHLVQKEEETLIVMHNTVCFFLSELTLELRFDLPALRRKAPEDMPFSVLYQNDSGTPTFAVAHQPGEAFPVYVCGEQQPPGGTVSSWQLR